MKTSSFLAASALIVAFAATNAANFKIKNEYSKGNITSAYAKTKLPPFRFIKEQLDSTTGLVTIFQVKAGRGIEPSLEVYYSLTPGYKYTVSHDTLLIGMDPLNKEGYTSPEPVIINAPALENLEVSKGLYYVENSDTGTLSVKTSGKSAANLKLNGMNRLYLDASEGSRITVAARQPVREAVIHTSGNALLSLDDALILKKSIRLEGETILQLRGRSLESLGVKQ
ncbi:MAG: hypothetical protein JO301_02080 [Chitinophagaceae bacterium]|nr:hypothetical protein [Chitinophagaceae bacterium]